MKEIAKIFTSSVKMKFKKVERYCVRLYIVFLVLSSLTVIKNGCIGGTVDEVPPADLEFCDFNDTDDAQDEDSISEPSFCQEVMVYDNQKLYNQDDYNILAALGTSVLNKTYPSRVNTTRAFLTFDELPYPVPAGVTSYFMVLFTVIFTWYFTKFLHWLLKDLAKRLDLFPHTDSFPNVNIYTLQQSRRESRLNRDTRNTWSWLASYYLLKPSDPDLNSDEVFKTSGWDDFQVPHDVWHIIKAVLRINAAAVDEREEKKLVHSTSDPRGGARKRSEGGLDNKRRMSDKQAYQDFGEDDGSAGMRDRLQMLRNLLANNDGMAPELQNDDDGHHEQKEKSMTSAVTMDHRQHSEHHYKDHDYLKQQLTSIMNVHSKVPEPHLQPGLDAQQKQAEGWDHHLHAVESVRNKNNDQVKHQMMQRKSDHNMRHVPPQGYIAQRPNLEHQPKQEIPTKPPNESPEKLTPMRGEPGARDHKSYDKQEDPNRRPPPLVLPTQNPNQSMPPDVPPANIYPRLPPSTPPPREELEQARTLVGPLASAKQQEEPTYQIKNLEDIPQAPNNSIPPQPAQQQQNQPQVLPNRPHKNYVPKNLPLEPPTNTNPNQERQNEPKHVSEIYPAPYTQPSPSSPSQSSAIQYQGQPHTQLDSQRPQNYDNTQNQPMNPSYYPDPLPLGPNAQQYTLPQQNFPIRPQQIEQILEPVNRLVPQTQPQENEKDQKDQPDKNDRSI